MYRRHGSKSVVINKEVARDLFIDYAINNAKTNWREAILSSDFEKPLICRSELLTVKLCRGNFAARVCFTMARDDIAVSVKLIIQDRKVRLVLRR